MRVEVLEDLPLGRGALPKGAIRSGPPIIWAPLITSGKVREIAGPHVAAVDPPAPAPPAPSSSSAASSDGGGALPLEGGRAKRRRARKSGRPSKGT